MSVIFSWQLLAKHLDKYWELLDDTIKGLQFRLPLFNDFAPPSFWTDTKLPSEFYSACSINWWISVKLMSILLLSASPFSGTPFNINLRLSSIFSKTFHTARLVLCTALECCVVSILFSICFQSLRQGVFKNRRQFFLNCIKKWVQLSFRRKDISAERLITQADIVLWRSQPFDVSRRQRDIGALKTSALLHSSNCRFVFVLNWFLQKRNF